MVMACHRVINTCSDWIWRSTRMAKPRRGLSAVEKTLYPPIVTVDLGYARQSKSQFFQNDRARLDESRQQLA